MPIDILKRVQCGGVEAREFFAGWTAHQLPNVTFQIDTSRSIKSFLLMRILPRSTEESIERKIYNSLVNDRFNSLQTSLLMMMSLLDAIPVRFHAFADGILSCVRCYGNQREFVEGLRSHFKLRSEAVQIDEWIGSWRDEIVRGNIDDAVRAARPVNFAQVGIDPLVEAFGDKIAIKLFTRIIPEGVHALFDPFVGEVNFVRVFAPKVRRVCYAEVCTPGAKIVRPDPLSRFQPFDVYGPSEALGRELFDWEGYDHCPRAFDDMMIREIHISTFSPDGTWKGLLSDEGRRMIEEQVLTQGFNTVMIMPIQEFPGRINWGYDSVFPNAPEHSYGRPDDIRRAVKMLHEMGISVVLDVQFNHLGGEGVYLSDFADRQAPGKVGFPGSKWGDGFLDLTGLDEGGEELPHRNLVVLQNRETFRNIIRGWVSQFGLDGMRLDASHFIAAPNSTFQSRDHHRANIEILALIREAAGSVNPDAVLIAEDERTGHEWHEVVDRVGEINQWSIGFTCSLLKMLGIRDHPNDTTCLTVANLFNLLAYGMRDIEGRSPNIFPPFMASFENHDEIGNYGGVRIMEHLRDRPMDYRLAIGLIFAVRGIPMHFQGYERPFPFFRDNRRLFDQLHVHDLVYLSHEDQRHAIEAGLKKIWRMRTGDGRDYDGETATLVSELSAFRMAHPAMKSRPHEHMIKLGEHIDDGILVIHRTDGKDDDVIVGINMSERDLGGERAATLGIMSGVAHADGRWRTAVDTRSVSVFGERSSMKIDSSTGTFQVPLPPRSAVFFERG